MKRPSRDMSLALYSPELSLEDARPLPCCVYAFSIAPTNVLEDVGRIFSLSRATFSKFEIRISWAPSDRPWRIPRSWRFSKPRVRASDLGECSWAEDFVSKKLTTHLYDIRALLKEEILSAVGLSPAVVPRTQSLGMSVKASLVAKVIKKRRRDLSRLRSPQVSLSSLHLLFTPAIPSPLLGRDPIWRGPTSEPDPEVRSSGLEPDPLAIERPPPILTIEAGETSDPKGKNKSKGKKDKARSHSGSKSKGSNGEKPSEEEISTALREIEDHQKKLALAREQAQAEASRPQRPFSGTRLVPKWNISSESSILKTRAGEDSLELYHGCILPQDQFALGVMPDTKLEKIAAHDLMRREKQTIEAKTKAEYDSCIREIMVNLAKLEARVKHSEESLQASRNEVAHLTRESRESFVAGQEAGKRETLNSPEFAQKLKDARIAGARDFKNSPDFDQLVVEKAVEFEVMGFFKCQSQTFKLGGFKTDFDPSKLDPELDGNGEKAPIMEEENEDLGSHEFGFLLQDSGSTDEGVPPPGGQTHEEGDDLLDVTALLGPS
ncbi:hypothetical protein DH2020_039079 [Rehmannia glutinosa]|uniref:Uncharacterized protein n=1 Tax=Rehmannia glutinosa TaxID=99300 RepID=A0ABR0UYQ4_REHGL